MLEHGEGVSSREEIIDAIRREIKTGGSLFKHEIAERTDSIEQADRSQLEAMRAHYQETIDKTVANLSSQPKGPANRDIERSGSRRMGHCENMINLLGQLIEITPEISEEQSES